jgi:hypothetical protein
LSGTAWIDRLLFFFSYFSRRQRVSLSIFASRNDCQMRRALIKSE